MLNSGAVNLYRNRFSFGSCPPGYQTASGGGVSGKTKTSPLEGGRKNRKDSMLFSMLLMIAQLGGRHQTELFLAISPDIPGSIQQCLWLVSLTIVLSLSLVKTGSSHRLLDLSLMLSKNLIHVHSRRHQWSRIVDSVLLCAIHLNNEKNCHHMAPINWFLHFGSMCQTHSKHSIEWHGSIYINL